MLTSRLQGPSEAVVPRGTDGGQAAVFICSVSLYKGGIDAGTKQEGR
jgi:hypothetical protein